jgi:hypothetical protein
MINTHKIKHFSTKLDFHLETAYHSNLAHLFIIVEVLHMLCLFLYAVHMIYQSRI